MVKTTVEVPSLSKVYEEYFNIGAAVNLNTLESQKDLLRKHFNSITAENDMKFIEIQPAEGQFMFENADRLAAFAKENGMKMRGHTLVWHNQTPDWVFQDADRETLLQRMKDHITSVMKRYKGTIFCWDVVNEAVTDEGPELYRLTKWLEIIGEDYIEKAFEFAHEADPDALLFYNDYNESNPEKREKIYKLVKSLIDKGVPIRGVGLQAHWNLVNPSLEDIRTAIERYASLGLKLHLTELDISVFNFEDKRTDLKQPTHEMLELQAERYQRVFQLLRQYQNHITSVTFWGAADDYTWLSDFPVIGRENWPFLFDENHQPKESFWKVVQY
ncbi:endo-1,4-beta-xylanase [Bacillus sp. EB106-08-02-XG196]|jgi:endo-1,4-beta-xylanase|uniref:endo-1,4-beta-xylanase n=1 Tax=Bacillus sp. EB106-08-02-XG196 TaxID=2737049 RepID=UPI0015C4185C|nr:endo-1,4-beta-xylanase [Bacillus sp. EB106-08-02-XG196]NWQ43648.1 endo-1,4-beta-xylanase [Bacillus sp. EB106-08-02-XG196]